MAKFHIGYINTEGKRFGKYAVEDKKFHIGYSKWDSDKDLTGRTFGRLYVEGYAGYHKGIHSWWCICSCKTLKKVIGRNLRNGHTQSCGCGMRESNLKHGMWKSRIYSSWRSMLMRCTNLNTCNYKDYGGRGIIVCDEWHEFINFYRDMGETYQEGLTIDRIDVNGNYEKTNTKWSTPKEQSRNRRNNVWVEYDGRLITIAELAEILGIRHHVLLRRHNKGYTGDELYYGV